MRRIVLPAAVALVVVCLICAGGGRLSPAAAQSFDICIEDDTNKANALRINSSSGDYMMCAGGGSFSGRGAVSRQGSVINFQHQSADRRLSARVDTSSRQASASFQSPPGKTLGNVRDGNTSDSACRCR